MSPLHRLDAILLRHVFQPVVDASQRQPAWWARQAVALTGVCLLLTGALYGWHWLLAVAALWIPAVLLLTRAPAALAVLGGFRYLRWGMLAFTVTLWVGFGFVLPEFGGSQWLRLLFDASQLSFLYFAACRPPAPPRRRTAPSRALPSGAA